LATAQYSISNNCISSCKYSGLYAQPLVNR